MNFTTNVAIDCTTDDNDVTLDKFFQFILLEQKDSKRCKVTVYNSIAYHSLLADTKLIISFEDDKGEVINDYKFEDKSDFYQQTDVLKQFWGKGSKYNVNISEAIDNYIELENKEPISKFLNQANLEGVFCVQEEKDEISNVLIKPMVTKKRIRT